MTTLRLCLRRLGGITTAVVLVSFASAQAIAAETSDAARRVLESAVAVWHCGDTHDSAGADSKLVVRGEATLGVELSGADRLASLARGGDGKVADLLFGWLDAGQGVNNELQLSGDQLTALVRLRSPTGRWATRGHFAKGGNHDQLVFNFFSHDFNDGPDGMRVGCEIGVVGKARLGGQVTAHLRRIGPSDWHDLVARYDGAHLVLFVDGVELDRVPCKGPLRQGNREPVAVGGGTYNGQVDSPFPGEIDHAALWRRALSVEEIGALAGGKTVVAERTKKYANFQPGPVGPTTADLVQSSRRLKEKFLADPQRPRYHFVCPEAGDNMPFDPNGAIFWKGRYHLFYIFQTTSPHIHHWGHASSHDLLHWIHHPTGLGVSQADPDRGIFSGNAFVNLKGEPTILYHGVNIGNCTATATDDDLLLWNKTATNPLVPIPKPGDAGHGKYESWDPHGWVENGVYYGIFGGRTPALFKGNDLTRWSYVGPFLKTDRLWDEPGEDVSCPDFFPLGNKHVLLCISHRRGARYFVGRWEKEQFIPERHERMNWPGGGFFAPETLLDDKNRRILWAWVMDPRSVQDRLAAGWSGVMSLPRVLSLDEKGQMRIEPAPELQQLRQRPVELRNLEFLANQETDLPSVRGDCLEIDVRFAPSAAKEVGLVVRQAPDNSERTEIVYDRSAGKLRVDFRRSSRDFSIVYRSWCITRPDDPAEANRRVTQQEAPLPLAPDEPLHLRVFLDRSMLEIFANGRQCVTQRIFPTRPDSRGVSIFTNGAPTKVPSIQAWELAPTNVD